MRNCFSLPLSLASLSLPLSISAHVYIHTHIYIYVYVYLSLSSNSSSSDIYIYTYVYLPFIACVPLACLALFRTSMFRNGSQQRLHLSGPSSALLKSTAHHPAEGNK